MQGIGFEYFFVCTLLRFLLVGLPAAVGFYAGAHHASSESPPSAGAMTAGLVVGVVAWSVFAGWVAGLIGC